MAAVRHSNDGVELLWFRNFSRGFEVFTFCVKVESLARVVGSHCFNFYGRVPGHGTRLLVLVMEKESEARRHIGFKDGDFKKAVTEVHEEAIVRSAFDFPTVMRVSARKMRMAAAFAMTNHMVQAKSHQKFNLFMVMLVQSRQSGSLRSVSEHATGPRDGIQLRRPRRIVELLAPARSTILYRLSIHEVCPHSTRDPRTEHATASASLARYSWRAMATAPSDAR